jgi:hypothetical protein
LTIGGQAAAPTKLKKWQKCRACEGKWLWDGCMLRRACACEVGTSLKIQSQNCRIIGASSRPRAWATEQMADGMVTVSNKCTQRPLAIARQKPVSMARTWACTTPQIPRAVVQTIQKPP